MNLSRIADSDSATRRRRMPYERAVRLLVFSSCALGACVLSLSWLLFTGKLTPASAFSGWCRVQGLVTDEAGKGLDEALIKVGPVGTKTDSKGIFEIDCLPAEKYLLSITREGYERFDTVFEFHPGEEPVKVGLKRTPLETPRRTRKCLVAKEHDSSVPRMKLIQMAGCRAGSLGGEVRGY
jgi:hypothetical protein